MSLKNLLEKYKTDPEFILEGLKYDLACEIKRIMQEKGVTNKELASRLGVSPAYISKVLGGSNITLKTLARILSALETDAGIRLVERKFNRYDNL